MTLHVEIVTPDKIVYSDDVDQITLSTLNGQITLLPNHVPLVTQLIPGECTVKKGSTEQLLAITGGFLEFSDNKVTIMADYAIRSGDIEEAQAEEARKRAEKALSEKASARDFAEAEAQMRKALLELKVVQKRKRTTLPS